MDIPSATPREQKRMNSFVVLPRDQRGEIRCQHVKARYASSLAHLWSHLSSGQIRPWHQGLCTVADRGEGHGGGRPPLVLDQTEAQRAEIIFFLRSSPPPLSQSLDDWVRHWCTPVFLNNVTSSFMSPSNWFVRVKEARPKVNLPPNNAIIWTENRFWPQLAWSHRVFLRSWLVVQLRFKLMASHSVNRHSPNWANHQRIYSRKNLGKLGFFCNE